MISREGIANKVIEGTVDCNIEFGVGEEDCKQ